jgi:hypothetical protein
VSFIRELVGDLLSESRLPLGSEKLDVGDCRFQIPRVLRAWSHWPIPARFKSLVRLDQKVESNLASFVIPFLLRQVTGTEIPHDYGRDGPDYCGDYFCHVSPPNAPAHQRREAT